MTITEILSSLIWKNLLPGNSIKFFKSGSKELKKFIALLESLKSKVISEEKNWNNQMTSQKKNQTEFTKE